MLGRRQIKSSANSHAPLRSSLANAAFAVEERVVWGGADVLRRAVDVIKWPFERAVWAIERGLVWPLEERTGKLNGSLRAAGLAALVLLAVGAGVLGLLWASGSGGGAVQQAQQPAPAVETPVVVTQVPHAAPKPAEPVLHGAVPDFTRGADAGATKATDSTAAKSSSETAATSAPTTSEKISSSPDSSAAAAAAAVPAGPAATQVAHQFASAFVLYEIGQDSAKVRETFAATATPRLAHALLQRPPRLPADAKVPKAKVLNVVPGPKHGDTYTLSVSLLRVGITSELRLTMERDKTTGKWQVVDTLG
jgi:hypothetical protein